jgi:HK97 family phage portal protein
MPSTRVRVVPDARRQVGGYVYRAGARELRFEPGEVIHFRYPNPRSDFYGAGPLQAAAESVDAHESLKSAQASSFAGGAFPGLVLTSSRPLSDAAVKRLEAKLRGRHGGEERAGKVLLLEEGLSASPLSFSPKEMDFLSSARVTRDEILGVFGVPAAIAGLAEDVNRASAAALDAIFARWTVRPKLAMLAEQLNQDLCPRFDPDLRCEFDDPVPADRAAEREDMLARVRSGVTTVNEERARLGLPPVGWGEGPARSAGAAVAPAAPSAGADSAEGGNS